MLRPPGGGTAVELSSFIRPDHDPGSPTAMANELGLRSIAFEIDDLHAAVDRLAADGYGLIGGIGQYENAWLMAYVRGPDGIIVALAERLAERHNGRPCRCRRSSRTPLLEPKVESNPRPTHYECAQGHDGWCCSICVRPAQRHFPMGGHADL